MAAFKANAEFLGNFRIFEKILGGRVSHQI